MWKAFIKDHKWHATCDWCDAEYPLPEAKTFTWCPKCGKLQKGVDMPPLEHSRDVKMSDTSRDKRMAFRVNAEELEMAERLCAYYDDVSVSALIRRMIRSRYESLTGRGKL